MKRVKRIISLILILTIICSMFFVVTAAEEDVSLRAFKEDGSALGADDVIAVGDKITVKMFINKSASAFSASFRIWFDKSVFDFESGSFSDTVKSAYSADQTIVNPTTVNKPTDEEQAKLNNGLLPVNLDVSAPGSHDVAMPTGEWASLVFVAINAAEGSLFQTQIRAIDSDEAMDDISGQFTAGTLSVTVEETAVAVTGITLDQASLALVVGGDTVTLTATVEPENATEKTVTWSSSNTSVATVDNGTVYPVDEGTAVITAEAGGKVAECTVIVSLTEMVPVQSITICKESDPVTNVTLGTKKIGNNILKTITLTAAVFPENATNPQVTWTSSDETVVSIDSTGKITAVSEGTAVITAEADGATASCNVTVIVPVETVKVEPNKVTRRVGNTVQLSASVTRPTNATIQTISWSSEDESIATVDETTGLVTIVGAGTVKINANAMDGSGKSGACTVTAIAGPTGGYSVMLPEEEVVASVNETVSIPISIQYDGEEGYSTFNTVEMMLKYDSDVLEYISESGNEGTIRLLDYGKDKELGDNAIILQFRIKKLEETTVSAEYARIDYYENAITQNIAEATLINSTTVIKVATTYNVELPEEITSNQGNTVRAGESYTFEISNYNPYYDYSFTVTMDGKTVKPTNNEDGSYTIDSVNGDIVVSNVTKNGKKYSVTITGEDTTGDTVAIYGTDYIFTVNSEPGYSYKVTATVNGESVYYTGPDNEGKYTITGTDITGPIEISVVKTVVSELWHEVTFSGNGQNTVIDPVFTALEGANYTFRLEKKDGYSYTVKYAVAGSSDKTLDANEDGSYTIPGNEITGDILITVEEKQVFTVSFTGNAANRVAYPIYEAVQGETYRFGVAQWYVYTYTVSVTTGETTTVLTSSTPEGSNSQTILYYDVPDVQGDLTIEINSAVTEDKVYILIEDYVEADGGTFYLIGAALKNPQSTQQFLSIFDENLMFRGNKYVDLFAQRMNITDSTVKSKLVPYVYLVFVPKGESKPEEADIMNKLAYDNKSAGNLDVTYDINGTGYVDVNDAQLVYDIYNGRYTSFDSVSMRKFLDADTNSDMIVNVTDAAVVVNNIA